jgi:DNA invertase Pin-like site-specific DNA recombinase
MTGNGSPLIPYLRQSHAKERTISIEEQRRDLAPEIAEQNVSGSKPWRDRALGAAIEACERGDVAGIIVAWQDRLSRENVSLPYSGRVCASTGMGSVDSAGGAVLGST